MTEAWDAVTLDPGDAADWDVFGLELTEEAVLFDEPDPLDDCINERVPELEDPVPGGTSGRIIEPGMV